MANYVIDNIIGYCITYERANYKKLLPCDHSIKHLRVLKRKVLHKISGLAQVGDNFRMWFNSELLGLLNNIDIMQCINNQRVRLPGHNVRMEKHAHQMWRFIEVGAENYVRRGRLRKLFSVIGMTPIKQRFQEVR